MAISETQKYGHVTYFFTEETLPETVRQQLKESGGNGWVEVVINQVKAYGIIVKDKVFFLFIIAGILLGQTYMQLDMLIPVYMMEVVKSELWLS